ncbi:MAG: M48 family metallopeptidase [Verrucomicrobiota bacterium]
MIETNFFFWVTLIFLIGTKVVEWIAEFLNTQEKDGLPAEVADLYDPEEYEKSRRYEKEKTRLSFIEDVLSLGLLLVFWFLGGFGWLEGVVQSTDLHPVLAGLLYFLILMGVQWLLRLPFDLYDTFRIEEEFGFNRTTIGTYAGDQVKQWILTIVLGGILGGAVLYLFQTAGDSAWIWCWGVFIGFNLVILYIAPIWLMPLFYKFTPLEEGTLRESIENYAKKESFPVKELFVIDGSRRSSKANAFFAGFGKNRRIALYDTLIEKQSVPELVGVLAHEIGHYRLKHVPKMVGLSFFQAGLMFFLAGLFVGSSSLAVAFGVQEPSVHTGLVFFGLLFSALSRVTNVGVQWLSRKHEFEADAFAAQTTGEGESLVSALKKLARENLSHLTPHPFYVFLHYSHPPLHERIRALRQ